MACRWGASSTIWMTARWRLHSSPGRHFKMSGGKRVRVVFCAYGVFRTRYHVAAAVLSATLFLFVPCISAVAGRIDDQFRAWLQTDLWPDAKARGISQQTFDAAFAVVRSEERRVGEECRA